jgi:hypothetical protein
MQFGEPLIVEIFISEPHKDRRFDKLEQWHAL